jgi:hypothetical protein
MKAFLKPYEMLTGSEWRTLTKFIVSCQIALKRKMKNGNYFLFSCEIARVNNS